MFDFTAEELRAIIQGKAEYKKCPDCQGRGIVYWKWKDDEQTDSIDIGENEYDPENDNHGHEECSNCDGVGYVLVSMNID